MTRHIVTTVTVKKRTAATIPTAPPIAGPTGAILEDTSAKGQHYWNECIRTGMASGALNSICRDSADTQYMIIQKNFPLSKTVNL